MKNVWSSPVLLDGFRYTMEYPRFCRHLALFAGLPKLQLRVRLNLKLICKKPAKSQLMLQMAWNGALQDFFKSLIYIDVGSLVKLQTTVVLGRP